jgi:hypothetical protein
LAANPLDEDDQIALSALGSTRPTPRTWFNEQVKLWNDCKVAGDIPIVYSDGENTVSTHTDIACILHLNEETASQLAAGKFYLGKTKTSLVHSYAATINAGDIAYINSEDMSSWMSVGDKVYWQFRPDAADPCEGANSGIYHFTAT